MQTLICCTFVLLFVSTHVDFSTLLRCKTRLLQQVIHIDRPYLVCYSSSTSVPNHNVAFSQSQDEQMARSGRLPQG